MQVASMNIRTKNFLRSRFREYYLLNSPEVPPGSVSREWGFILFDDMPEIVMRRHKSFTRQSELLDYIRAVVPAHVFHSAAYYQRPDAPTMKEKLWSGADLIFDLDADHLHNAPKNYKGMLELVKKETQKLLNFLLSDFGFSESNISVVFSGGRGYHIHVRDPVVFELGSDERREIIDYLTGRGLDIKRFISEEGIGGDFGVEKANRLKIPSEDAAGWGGRINRSLLSFVTYLRELDETEAVELLSSRKRIGAAKAAKFYRNLKRDDVLAQIKKGNLSSFRGGAELWKMLIQDYLDDEGVSAGLSLDDERGETDEPVTADVKRLIRFPMSLHGGSGFRVTPLTIEDLKSFEPLRDAVVFCDQSVFGDRLVSVEVKRSYDVELGSESYHLQEGESEVPLCVAVFLMARGFAELGKVLDG
jgi:DNA primase small subunit